MDTLTSLTKQGVPPATGDDALDVAELHAQHGQFVWKSLARLGVREDDLADVMQDVFLIVHQRKHSFRGDSKVSTWLFGICLRVARKHRQRRARLERRYRDETPDALPDHGVDPEDVVARRQAERTLRRVLDALPVDKRAVFVMFEIDGMACDEIAEVLGVPLGTVYSRLHGARKAFQRSLARVRAQQRREATP